MYSFFGMQKGGCNSELGKWSEINFIVMGYFNCKLANHKDV